MARILVIGALALAPLQAAAFTIIIPMPPGEFPTPKPVPDATLEQPKP
jgi:hypothetical protein